jgi:serine/threonine protein phosphatase PrpC
MDSLDYMTMLSCLSSEQVNKIQGISRRFNSLILEEEFAKAVEEQELFEKSPSSIKIPSEPQERQYKYCAGFIAKNSEMMHMVPDGVEVNEDELESGEDSFFVSPMSNSSFGFGIADGVGGWKRISHNGKQMNSGAVSRMIMKESKKVLGSDPAIHTSEVMKKLDEKIQTVSEEEIPGGASTCTLLNLQILENGYPILHFANLGDSTFTIIRDGEIIHDEPEQKYINMAPYQFAVIHPDVRKKYRVSSTPASDASIGTFSCASKDVIVLGTDGIWDNLSGAQLLDLVREYQTTGCSLQALTEKIVLTSYQRSKSGGKPDDITCVVVEIL